MERPLAKLLRRIVSRFQLDTGIARHRFDASAGRMRVLAYHGIVPDALADRPWVPSHYVTVSQFERQMALLTALGPSVVQPMRAAIAGLGAHHADHPVVCLTFDDGMADNAELALPILDRYGLAATFFLATGHVDTGTPLVNDMIRLLRHAISVGRCDPPGKGACLVLLTQPNYYKSASLFAYRQELLAFWNANRSKVDRDAMTALAIMSWDQARRLRDAGMEIGAHTVDHVILSRERDSVRRDQIVSSVRRIQAELKIDRVPFAYPNGRKEDFGAPDTAVLEELGTPCAATTVPGWNDATTPRLTLRRSCIGLHHSDRAFLAAVFGVLDRDAVAPARRTA